MSTLDEVIKNALKIAELRAQICSYETVMAQCEININKCQEELKGLCSNIPQEGKLNAAA